MAETFGFFDAEETNPGEWDREYIAEQWANYFKLFIGNGVFSSPTNQLKVRAYPGLYVKVSAGWAFINGYWYHNDTDLVLEIPANQTASAITTGVFVQFDSSTREIHIIAASGRTTVNRVAPYYELKLADIAVATGAVEITEADITDTRPDTAVCGFVTGVVDVIDSTDLFAQYQAIFDNFMAQLEATQGQIVDDTEAWLQTIHDILDSETATHLQLEIDGLDGRLDTAEDDIDDLEAGNAVTTLSVDLTGWTQDTSSQSGTTLYKKQISLNHVYVDSPTVDIGAGTGYTLPTVAQQMSYNLLQYVTVDDSVPCLYLYASAIPTTSFYISVVGVD